ncbi:hypothetical protein OPV22_021775 [Ensete ventricosum]|uniref:Uncharacterized protein n=1 Tax=Ensete ventricosum TaxID=4639 RepID=A0AAV8QSZ2_ENSVE|nr:hypothetical protein OPV22_021775 [Ensete ventricosum]
MAAVSFQTHTPFLFFFLLLLLLLLFTITPQVSSSRPIRTADPTTTGAAPRFISSATSKQEQLAEKYTPLLLNLLPRAMVPPSGPSPGINCNNKS